MAGGTRDAALMKKSFFDSLWTRCWISGHIGVSSKPTVYAITRGDGGESDVAAGHRLVTVLVDFGYARLTLESIFLNLSIMCLSIGQWAPVDGAVGICSLVMMVRMFRYVYGLT